MSSGIYQIIHTETGRRYVGQALDITKRWRAHRLRLNKSEHHAPHLQAAWLKYGPAAFAFEIVELCGVTELDRTEQRYLDEMQPEFNTAKFARTRRGVPHSEDSKARLSASLKGRKRTEEECANISAGLKGLRHSDEAKAKMRAAKLGRKHSEQSRQKMIEAQARRGPTRPASEYDSRRGRKADPDAIARSAAKRTGVKRTPEQIERILQGRRNAAAARDAT